MNATLKSQKATLAGMVLVVLIIVATLLFQSRPTLGASSAATPTFATASSTVFTLTTTSQRLLATTTTPRRYAATVQNINCTTGSAIFLKMGTDVPAVSNTGLAVLASSTLALADYPQVPVVQGAVQGIANGGTCTVLVTEWRTQY